jgi:hypothetical protein
MRDDFPERRWFWATLALSSISIVGLVFAVCPLLCSPTKARLGTSQLRTPDLLLEFSASVSRNWQRSSSLQLLRRLSPDQAFQHVHEVDTSLVVKLGQVLLNDQSHLRIGFHDTL